MHRQKLFSGAAMLAGLFLLAACGGHYEDEHARHQPSAGQLTRTFDMMDKDGRRYGTVEMDPVGGGRVFDADGRMIGRIVPPRRDD